MPIEALGTTHADTFYGDVPVTDALTKQEIEEAYEENTGKVIVRTFKEYGIDPDVVPAVLVKQHGPFTRGPSPKKAVENAKILEVVAEMNYHALQLTRVQTSVCRSSCSTSITTASMAQMPTMARTTPSRRAGATHK